MQVQGPQPMLVLLKITMFLGCCPKAVMDISNTQVIIKDFFILKGIFSIYKKVNG